MLFACVEYSIVSNPRLALLFRKLVLSNNACGFFAARNYAKPQFF